MDNKEKILTKIKLGLAIKAILADNKKSASLVVISSLRKLAASSGIEYSIIQKISSGQKDPQFTTLISLAEGLGLSLQDILSKYESIDTQSVLKVYNAQKKISKNRK